MLEQNGQMLTAFSRKENRTREENMRRELERKEIEQQREDRRLPGRKEVVANTA